MHGQTGIKSRTSHLVSHNATSIAAAGQTDVMSRHTWSNWHQESKSTSGVSDLQEACHVMARASVRRFMGHARHFPIRLMDEILHQCHTECSVPPPLNPNFSIGHGCTWLSGVDAPNPASATSPEAVANVKVGVCRGVYVGILIADRV